VAEGDVTIGITVEDSTAMAKLAELQAQLDKMGGPQGAGAMKAGIRVGQIFPEDLEKMASAGGRYKQVMDEVANATGKVGQSVTGATNELRDFGEGTRSAGSAFEGMATRMVERLVIMEAIRLALKGIVDAFKEVAGFEAARVSFENLAEGVGQVDTAEQMLIETSRKNNEEFTKLSKAFLSLEEAGEGPIEAARDVDILDERAKATGLDVDALGKAFEKVKLGEGTVQDMISLASAAGTAKDELMGQVSVYAQLQRENKELNDAGSERLRVLREQTHEIDHQIEESRRADKEQFDAAEKQIQAQQKLNDVRESFLEKLLGAEGKPPGQVDPTLARAMRPGGLPETAGGKQMTKDIQLGFQEIYKEEDLTTAGMQHYVNTGLIGLRDILAAAKRYHEAEDEARKKAEADRQKAFDEQKRLNDQKLQSTADTEAERRRNAAVEADKIRLDLNQKLVAATQDQSNIAGEYAKAMGTVNEKFASIATSLKAMVDDAPLLLQSLNSIADTLKNITGSLPKFETKVDWDPGWFLKGVGNLMGGVGDIQKGWEGLMKQFFPQKASDDLSRIAAATEGIHGTLTGAGTP
jgi:hypothetical protein